MLADQLGIKTPYVSMYINGKPVTKPVQIILDDYFHNSGVNIMSKQKFTGIQVREFTANNSAVELTVDFGVGSSGRHHAGSIPKGFMKEGVVLLLRRLANHIENDELIK